VSLQPSPIPPVPAQTAAVARAAFRRPPLPVRLRDELGVLYEDADFAALFPARGQPALPPWRLAVVTVLQFLEGLSDRQAADAVRARIDWKYALGPVLSEFRTRLVAGGQEALLLDRLLARLAARGLARGRGRQRTDSTHVLTAVRALNRLELVAEALRAALNAVAAAAPDWLGGLASPDWHERYDRRVEDARLPETGPKRDAYVARVGADGYRLIDALDGAGAPPGSAAPPAVAALRRVWARHFERVEAGPGGDPPAGARLRPVQGRGPGDRIESPYDLDARFRAKAGEEWTGYMVHLSETCDEGAPRLVVHAATTPANVHEAMRTEAIHDALAGKGLAPRERLVDSAYVSAAHLVAARERHGIDPVGPARPSQSWQDRDEGAFHAALFTVDRERRRVRCPEGHESASWGEYTDRAAGRSYVRVGFSPTDCRPCPARSRRTRAACRRLGLHPRPEHEALAAARARLETEEGRRLHAQRRGVEGTLSQGVRAFGLRRARHRGLVKVGLQNVATAAAINMDRLAAWFAERPLAPTRTSRFAGLTA
jgi:transposase